MAGWGRLIIYTIDIRRDMGLLDIRFAGVFDLAMADAYCVDVERAFAASGLRPGYLFRMDFGAPVAQPLVVAKRLNERLANFPKARRIGIVAPSAIAKMQIRRLMPQPYLKMFDDRESALAWLLTPEQDAA